MLTCLVASCTLGRKGRDINLITGVEHRLRTFFSLTAYSGSFIEELNLVRDFVIGQSLPPLHRPQSLLIILFELFMYLLFIWRGTQ
jgi:hypothetical protein